MKKIIIGTTAIGAMILGVGFLNASDTYAASMTINPGDDVWAAVNQLENNEKLTFNAGTYTLDNYIDIVGKSGISLVGVGDVVLEYDGAGGHGVPGIKQAVQIYNSQNITVSNLKINAIDDEEETEWTTASTGVGVNSSCGVTLSDLTITGFGKSAVTVTAYQDGTETCASSNIALNNLDLEGDAYGIMFTNGSAAPVTNITGVTFSGVTKIAGVGAGIVTDGDYAGAVKGANDGDLALGVVNITTKTGQGAVVVNAGSKATISQESVINGVAVSKMSQEELIAALGDNVLPQSDLSVPSTGEVTIGGRTVSADMIALLASVILITGGFSVAVLPKIVGRKPVSFKNRE